MPPLCYMVRSGGVFYMNNSKKEDLNIQIALFRYELIVPVLNETYPDRSACYLALYIN